MRKGAKENKITDRHSQVAAGSGLTLLEIIGKSHSMIILQIKTFKEMKKLIQREGQNTLPVLSIMLATIQL